jgi:hypothetical protein
MPVRVPSQAELMRREKESQLANIDQEIKKFDIDAMREETLHKMNTMANDLTKSERAMIHEERKNLKYLDRVNAMQKALVEDHQAVKEALRHNERLKERAQENFKIIERENLEE